MFNPINGWTKAKIIKHIEKNFKGKSVKKYETTFSKNNEVCLYRGPEGKKCAVGMFIDDEDYSPDMEETNASKNIEKFSLEKDMPIPTEWINEFQQVHDRSRACNTKKQLISWIKKNVK